MKKVKMKAFIVHFMAEWKDTTVLISCIKDAVNYCLHETDIMLTDDFDSKLSCVLDVIKKERGVFGLREDNHYLTLKYPDKLQKYLEEWSITEEVQTAIKNYVVKAKDPLYYSAIDIGQAMENEEKIKSDKKYIEWICKLLEEIDTISNRDSCLAKDGEGVENLIILVNFFNLVSRYCTKNLISCWQCDNAEGYVIKYRTDIGMKYFKLVKVLSTGLIKITSCDKVDRAIYFPDIAMDVPTENLKEKKDWLESFTVQLQQACKIDVPYYKIREVLDKAFGLDEEE